MITQEQQNQVSDYCHQCGIKYYDVELEVLDHIAEWIENDMTRHELSFEESFQRMQQEFTTNDCREIVRSRSQGIRARILRSFLYEIADYFSWPKIAVVFALTAFVILVDRYLSIDKFPSMAIHFINLTSMMYMYGSGRIVRQNREEKAAFLIGWKQINTLNYFMIMPAVIYLLASIATLGESRLTLTENRVLLYTFPVVMIMSLAWRSAVIAANQKLRKDYPGAFVS